MVLRTNMSTDQNFVIKHEIKINFNFSQFLLALKQVEMTKVETNSQPQPF